MSSKKSRKRRRQTRRPATQPKAPKPAEETSAPRRGDPAERPAAPWGSFPLSELAILVGAVLLVLGFVGGSGQATLIVAGLAIASLGALEVSLREHLAGYRSHTLLLAGVPAVVTLGLLYFLASDAVGQLVRLAIAIAMYALAAWALTALFRARSGSAFRVRAPRRQR